MKGPCVCCDREHERQEAAAQQCRGTVLISLANVEQASHEGAETDGSQVLLQRGAMRGLPPTKSLFVQDACVSERVGSRCITASSGECADISCPRVHAYWQRDCSLNANKASCGSQLTGL